MDAANSYLQKLVESVPLREPLLRKIIASLNLPTGSHGLDAGCGIGHPTLLLADGVGLGGHVTGFDLIPELLAYGIQQAEQAGFSSRVTFRQGDIRSLPWEDDTIDWAWSADCIGYPLGDMAPFLQELMRVVKPGGSIYILAWSSQQLLPGYLLLEARLNATCSAYIPYLTGKGPELTFLRGMRAFRHAGLEAVEAHTYVGDVQAPLSPGVRNGLFSLFNMLWGQRQPEVTPEDWNAYQRLCLPGSPECILDVPEYYAFFTYTLFQGKVPHNMH
ncbi:MAG: class I SAM-dependent methyltransferase [Anaerolineales bacterium]|nr:class I SAM-dependent methyltransferase [Anaerolineales bacterium]